MQKRNTGHRTRPAEHSPAERVKRRAAQAARAILAGRGDQAAQWIRVARILPFLGSRDAYGRWAGQHALEGMPAALLDAAFPPEAVAEPESVDESGYVTVTLDVLLLEVPA